MSDKKYTVNANGETVTLTAAEVVALEACLAYDKLSVQLYMNESDAGIKELKKALGWSEQRIRKLIGGLEKKGLGEYDEFFDRFYLSRKGIYAIFAIIGDSA